MAAIDDLQAAERGCAELDSIAEAEEEPGALAALRACARAWSRSPPGARRRRSPRCAARMSSGGALQRRTRAPERES